MTEKMRTLFYLMKYDTDFHRDCIMSGDGEYFKDSIFNDSIYEAAYTALYVGYCIGKGGERLERYNKIYSKDR